jgi:hypothetical protein
MMIGICHLYHQGKPPAGILEMQQKFLEIRVIFSKVVNKASK